MTFPELTQYGLDESNRLLKTDLTQITICNRCNEQYLLFRLGCKCGAWARNGCEWVVQNYEGKILYIGVDICLL
jgi:hypothetical protein